MSSGGAAGQGTADLRILVEAGAGAGKTTAFRRLAGLLPDASGFTTEELREGGRRVGFAVESLDGTRAVLAHVSFRGGPRVGRYGVDLEAFERVALPSLRGDVVLIDELGKMELLSGRFRDAVLGLFDSPDVEIVRLTAASRDELPERLATALARESGADAGARAGRRPRRRA